MIKSFKEFIRESINHNRFKKDELELLVKKYVDEATMEANKYLSSLNLDISVNLEYNFEDFDEEAIGVYESGSVFEGTISVSYNLPALLDCFNEEIDSYPKTSEKTILEEMTKTTIYHEMGHGLCELINDYLQNTDDLDQIYDENKDLFDRVLDNEEESVEEFAWDFYDGKLEGNDVAEMIKLYLSI